ncbi:MAG: phosphotransferase [Alphaproteobacteria bacterium]|nr:phosphotransferase [Alphaproteobacteria bacterium]
MNTLSPDANAGPVNAAHAIDEASLTRWFSAHVEPAPQGLAVRQIAGGQSNPTYLLDTGKARFVLRKKPPGTLLKSAHQVEREYRIMKALDGTGVPVPKVLALCEDDSVIGTPFYVMAYLDGRIFRDPQLPSLSREERAAIYDSMNAVLARLHQVDVAAARLSDFGKPGNYFERQITRWIAQYRGAQTTMIEAMEQLIAWMPAHIPADQSVSIAHGDFRLENSIYHPTEPRMIAVLDWELSTIGHPLADLGYNCMGYRMISPTQSGLLGLDFAATGIPSEEDYVRAYCRRTGRPYPIPDWDFYIGFSIFRLAAIAQGVYKRGLDGNASSEKARSYGDACRFLAETAWKLVSKT